MRKTASVASPRRGSARRFALFLAASVAPACKCAEEHPYTPFRIADSSANPSATVAMPPPDPSASASAREAVLAPKDTNAWVIGDVPVNVAPERVIDRAVAADFDGDGSKDAVAWTRARTEPTDSHATGELVFFGGKTPAGRVVAKMPAFVPSGPGCVHSVRLAATGPRTVTLDVSARCTAPLVPRSPTRGLLVVSPGDERASILGLRVADAAPGESFTLSVDSTDRDGDGRDDVRLTIALKSEGNDSESAVDLAWVDRAAGASLDRAEPARSLGTFAALLVDKAKSKSTSREVPPLIENARRLLGTICAEWGTARIFDQEGTPIPCGDLSAGLGSILTSEVRSALIRKDSLAAFAALGRDGWYGAHLSPKAHRSLEKEALVAAPRRATTAQALNVTPRAGSGLPRHIPLAFDQSGSLLVETTDGVVRVRLPDGKAEDGSEAVDAWPLTVGSGADPRWTGVGFPCDRSEMVLLLTDAAGTPIPSRPTRILAPRPGLCAPGAPAPTPSLSPLEWSGPRSIGLVGGALFGVKELSELAPNGARGTPRSADGKYLVYPSSMGLLVVAMSNGKAETWTVEDPPSLSDCVIANGAAGAACVSKDRAVAFTPEAKASAARK